MAEKVEEVFLDRAQVKKAAQALLSFLKSSPAPGSLLLEEAEKVSLLFVLWKIPRQAQKIRLPLPHGLRSDTEEVCLFTRDEPNMTAEQTQRFYKRLLQERGVENISAVIPYNMLKKEYKPYEAKIRLMNNFDLFLSDDRVRRLLPSHIGKHFYERKKDPLSVNLQSKQLARDLQRLIQGSTLTVSKKGSCSMARVAHSKMTAEEITDNVEAAVRTVMQKIHQKGKVIKSIHLKSDRSVSLPIYTSDLDHLTQIEEAQRQAREAMPAKPKGKKRKLTSTENSAPKGSDQEEEEIPELVPIVTPSKKSKLQTPPKKNALENAPGRRGKKPAPGGKRTGPGGNRTGPKGPKAKGKLTKKAAQVPSKKFKRRVLKS